MKALINKFTKDILLVTEVKQCKKSIKITRTNGSVYFIRSPKKIEDMYDIVEGNDESSLYRKINEFIYKDIEDKFKSLAEMLDPERVLVFSAEMFYGCMIFNFKLKDSDYLGSYSIPIRSKESDGGIVIKYFKKYILSKGNYLKRKYVQNSSLELSKISDALIDSYKDTAKEYDGVYINTYLIGKLIPNKLSISENNQLDGLILRIPQSIKTIYRGGTTYDIDDNVMCLTPEEILKCKKNTELYINNSTLECKNPISEITAVTIMSSFNRLDIFTEDGKFINISNGFVLDNINMYKKVYDFINDKSVFSLDLNKEKLYFSKEFILNNLRFKKDGNNVIFKISNIKGFGYGTTIDYFESISHIGSIILEKIKKYLQNRRKNVSSWLLLSELDIF